MRASKMLISTLREVPAEAEIESHKLMLRAGMMRKMAAGIYNYMPLGLKVLKKIEDIVREEMDNAGAQEFLASALLPSELWKESGRWVFKSRIYRADLEVEYHKSQCPASYKKPNRKVFEVVTRKRCS